MQYVIVPANLENETLLSKNSFEGAPGFTSKETLGLHGDSFIDLPIYDVDPQSFINNEQFKAVEVSTFLEDNKDIIVNSEINPSKEFSTAMNNLSNSGSSTISKISDLSIIAGNVKNAFKMTGAHRELFSRAINDIVKQSQQEGMSLPNAMTSTVAYLYHYAGNADESTIYNAIVKDELADTPAVENASEFVSNEINMAKESFARVDNAIISIVNELGNLNPDEMLSALNSSMYKLGAESPAVHKLAHRSTFENNQQLKVTFGNDVAPKDAIEHEPERPKR